MSDVKKFLPVRVIEPFLGVGSGTLLKFDSGSGRYKSVIEEEDIADHSYYYSGSAIELDPTIIEANLGVNFEYWEEPKITTQDLVKHTITKEDVELNPGEDLEEGEEIEIPAEAYTVEEATLSFECGLCHTIHPLVKMKYGLFFPVGRETKLTLKCDNCGIETDVFYEFE